MPNEDEGIRSLVEDLRGRSCDLIVLEATGGFEIAVVVALAAAKHTLDDHATCTKWQ